MSGRRSPDKMREVYEVKMRSRGDRINSNGKKVEGGSIFSRHFEANNHKHAAKRACGQGRIIGVRKVKPEDIIGTIDSMNLSAIIGRPMKETYKDPIMNNMTLDEVIFGSRNRK